MPSPIRTKMLRVTENGNDANDNRGDPNYLSTAPQKPNWMNDFVLTQEQIEELGNPVWVFSDVIIQGHLITIVGPPGCGKTALAMSIASEVPKDYEVFYVNADVSGSGAKEAALFAAEHKFTMMLPDMKQGMSMDDVVEHLVDMNMCGGDFSNMVFFFDTLKKMTDVINKSKSKELLKTLRGLSAKGMTIVLLAHTNKHKGDDGKDVFEGTGDLRADVDEMIYLESVRHGDNSLTISTRPDKTRGDFQPVTFEMAKDRTITLSNEFRDIAKEREAQRQRERDDDYIEFIKEALCDGCVTQNQIVKYCKGFGAKKIREVLKRYSHESRQIWQATRREKNSWNYKLVNEIPDGKQES